jgi:hypothetical protein
MADPIEVIRAALVAAAPVTTIVGDRISEAPRAQGEVLPAVVLTVVSRVAIQHLQGDANLDEVRVQVDSFATTKTGAAALAAAVRAALIAPDRILQNEIGDFDQETETPVVSQDFTIWIDPTA